ncbi:thermonuclease family protein [Saezia sanguinis]|uniref:thermonuclease family protein n=1 Tax=Saezia sanguinis TaxID=1965230 RepID=UPI00302A9E8C
MLEILFCLVVGITDGDTLKARCGEPGNYEQVRVRIVAIDAPERGQDYSVKAREYLSDLCYQVNAEIIVHGRDRYGRIVGQVICNDVDTGSALVEEGLAWVYPQYAKDHEYLYGFQNHAQNEELNIWSMPNPVPPWEWRRESRE